MDSGIVIERRKGPLENWDPLSARLRFLFDQCAATLYATNKGGRTNEADHRV